MTQPTLFAPRPAPLPALVDLRCSDVAAVLATVEPGTVDLVVADPPWDLYAAGRRSDPGAIYGLLTPEQIGAHLSAAAALLRPGGRLALWTCWPLLVEVLDGRPLPSWLMVPGIKWKTGGAWTKTGPGHPGVGYHWRGQSEPVLIGATEGTAGRAACIVRSGHASTPEEHSRKPALWMADWCRAWVPLGGLVLDLYAGLGSVAEAVVIAGGGRRYIGAEIDPDRHAGACGRVARASRG